MIDKPSAPDVDSAKLVDWKNPPSLAALKQDFLDAQPSHSAQEETISGWLDNLNITGKAVVDSPKGNSRIVPRLIRKQAEWRYSSLSEPFLSTDDVFNVSPVTWEDKKGAQQNQLVLNNQFNTQIDKTSFIDDYVRTAVDEGTVILRVGWEFQEEEYEGTFPQVQFVVNPEMAPLHEQLAQLKQEDPGKYMAEVPEEMRQAHDMSVENGEPIEPQVIGQKTETRTRSVYNRPTLEICDYRNVRIDPTCLGKLDKARFVVYSFESSLAELKAEGKYKNLEDVKGSETSVLGQPDYSSEAAMNGFTFKDKPRKKLVVHEYWGFWDIDGTGVVKPFVAAWVGNTLVRMEDNPYPDKKVPFVSVQYLPVRRSIYGEPDGALLEDNQRIIGAVTRGMIDVFGKSANGQTGMRKDMLDATNRRKFDKGQDYEFNSNVDPRQGVHMHVFPEIPNSAQFMLSMQNMEAESLTGVKSFSQGVSGASLGNVAAGVRGALDASSKRELGILRRLSAGLCQVGRKFISMNGEFLSDVEVIRITNDEFVQVKRDDLAGAFDLKLSISTAESDDNKAKELSFMLQTMGNNMDPNMSKMILSDIAKLRKMPELAKKIESYQPQPDPMAQETQQLQLELLRAQIATEQAKAASLGATSQLSGSKVGTEMAKQNHLKSDTDQKNLDFVEQESGVKQERALQQTGEQARSQGQLKQIDHQFKREEQNRDDLKEYLATNLQ